MTAKKKPRLALLSGKKTQDVDALAKLFKRLTGKDVTPKERIEMQKILDG
jgi:hypothetical protein